MKIRTKLLTAVLATATALSCALTASALTEPKFVLQGNETAPAKVEKNGEATATLTLKASDFTDVAGAKIVLTLNENLSLKSATVTDAATTNKWEIGSDNSRVSGNTVTLVDVFNMTGATTKTDLELVLEFTVNNPNFGSYDVTVSGDYADSEATQVYRINSAVGKFVINRSEASADSIEKLNGIVNSTEYFIPYGGASIGGKSLTKNNDGTFDIDGLSGEISVLKCKLPAKGKDVTTFAISQHETDTNSVQFGSYAPKKGGLQYGTFVIIGDYEAFKVAKKVTDADALSKFATLYKTNIEDDAGKTENNYMKIKYGAGEYEYILVGRKTQTKHMWLGNSDQLQYALRMTNISDADRDKTFTAVGYSLNNGTYNFSDEMQSTTLNKLYNQ